MSPITAFRGFFDCFAAIWVCVVNYYNKLNKMSLIQLDTLVSQISQVGEKTATKLAKLGISTVQDLLFYFPFRYEDFSQVVNISELCVGSMVTVFGRVEMIKNRRSWQKRINVTEALISDDSGSIKVVWFNQPYLTKNILPGDSLYISGRVASDSHSLQLVNPVYEKIKMSGLTIHTARLVPIYSVTQNLSQKQIRWLISLAVQAADQLVDWLPKNLITELNLLDLSLALKQIHFPDDQAKLQQAVRRLKFNELFLFLLQTRLIKSELQSFQAPQIEFKQKEVKGFVDSLPFELTDDQKKAAWQIINDMHEKKPMNRLLEGDVGAGKTVVAALVAFNAILSGVQVCLMAPTEILAFQHFDNLKKMMAGRGVNVGLLTRTKQEVNNKETTKQKMITSVKNGQIDLLVGTHALIAEKLNFYSLGLVIIDEQHRFGVEQRKILHQKGTDGLIPHFLSMTATPIPRSLSLALYGDLDLTAIKQMPKARKKIITQVFKSNQRQRAYQLVSKQIQEGHQVFVVCPLIDPSDKLGVKSVTEEFTRLKENVFKNYRIDLLHGRLKTVEKQKIMAKFLAKQSDILVTTSVIEVGVDVPNATVMLIESAQRFGLAQLHQLRGRVGRSNLQSYCFLLSDQDNFASFQRLKVLEETQDGFTISQKDLEFRGPGEFFGVSQSGWPEFRIASLFDNEIMKLAKRLTDNIIDTDPTLSNHPLIKEKIAEAIKKVHLE